MSKTNKAPGFPKLGAVPIDLDRPRTMRWTHDCIFAVERLGGINLLNASADELDRLNDPDLTLLSAMLYGALKHEDKRLTVEDCVQLVVDGDVPAIYAKVLEVYAAGMPKRKKPAQADDAAATPDPLSPETGTSG